MISLRLSSSRVSMRIRAKGGLGSREMMAAGCAVLLLVLGVEGLTMAARLSEEPPGGGVVEWSSWSRVTDASLVRALMERVSGFAASFFLSIIAVAASTKVMKGSGDDMVLMWCSVVVVMINGVRR